MGRRRNSKKRKRRHKGPGRPLAHVNSPSQTTKKSLTVRHTGISFSGPLPPPGIFQGFEDVLPGSAERILAMSEKQADHRRKIEATVVDGNAKAQLRGQIMAFLLALLVIGIGFALIWTGKNVWGIVAIITALATPVATFITGKVIQFKERSQKRRDLDEMV